MQPLATSLIAALVAAVLALAAPFLEEGASKCSPRSPSGEVDMPDRATVVDGEMVAEGTGADLMASVDVEEEDLGFVEPVCWEKAERWFDVRRLVTRSGDGAAGGTRVEKVSSCTSARTRGS